MGSSVRILIADDHLVYREGMRALLAPDGAVEIVAEVGSGDQALAEALRLEPDVVLMDLKMPGLNGIEATRRIHEQRPQIRVLVVTMFDDDDSVFAAMRAGARGYLLKDADQEEIIRAIWAVQRGEAIFGPAVAARMIDYFSGFASRARAQRGATDETGDLTESERRIWR
jgi:DNA-binding NarL/FixJ family response regulator